MAKDDKKGQCPCGVEDFFADLPPELRPKPKDRSSNLRKVTCPVCGLVYWTNRDTDVCMQCEKREQQQPSS